MKAVLEAKPNIAGFGPVRQMGHVVDDIDSWVETLSRDQNIGPWMVMRNVPLPSTFKGEKSKPRIHVALAYVGDMQIELIQPLDDQPSPYLEVVRSGEYGLHHTAHLCADIHRDVARAEKAGWVMVCDIRMMGSRYVYLQKPEGGPYVEFLPASFMMRSMYRQGKAAAERWDGTQRTITMDLKNIGSILASLPAATGAWLSQR